MATKIYSALIQGLSCQITEVQADISNGMPYFAIVGLGDASVQESKERVRTSIKNSGMEFPVTRKTINLAPAGVRKQGSLLDLPIAIGILIESKQMPAGIFEKSIIIGELSLSGQVKPIKGTLAITQAIKQKGFTRIFLPAKNALEASFIEGIEIFPICNLTQLINFAKGIQKIEKQKFSDIEMLSTQRKHKDLRQIIGQEKSKRALAIAAAGGHNILLYGSPGYGKTILCRAFQALLPKMQKQEIFETTKIFSISGLLDPQKPLVLDRPFREVHHTASLNSIVGGGSHPTPGEISLAHNGVLFFDEIAEFPRAVLEALRQPLEDKKINISRVNYSECFPCNFIFMATMNPCPCGFHYDKKNPCKCTETQINNYQKKLSGPILDRFDIFTEVINAPMKNIFEEDECSNKNSEKSFPKKIEIAQKAQQKRGVKNTELNFDQIRQYCQLDQEAQILLTQAAEKLPLSNRGYLKAIKLSRTIADLEQQEAIKYHHLAEALQYRQK